MAELNRALQCRQALPGLFHRSDRSSQYASADYQALLMQAQIVISMSRTGDCWDNAAMENFFATLKAELPLTVLPSLTAARSAVVDSDIRHPCPPYAKNRQSSV